MSRHITMILNTARAAGLAIVMAFGVIGAPAFAAQATIVALGDSLVAGLGLQQEEAFPARLEAALRARGKDVSIVNAGVSGDTTAGGLGRLDWSVPDGTDGVILELGANDMLRGIDPAQTRKNLDAILSRLKERDIPVLVAGMRASPNLGSDYAMEFDAIFADLAQKYGAALYPFFLDGVAAQAGLNQDDGMHPNSAGVDAIVARFLPAMEDFLARSVRQASTN